MKSINPNELSKHTPEMEKIIFEYTKAIDKEIYDFVNDIIHGKNPRPITVGYLSQNQRESITSCMNILNDFAPRCILDGDSVRHIINRHGKNGIADHSMENIQDIARMAYVIANFDEVQFDGIFSSRFLLADGSPAPHITLKKRIDGTYYVIEAVTDSKMNKSHVVSAYIG